MQNKLIIVTLLVACLVAVAYSQGSSGRPTTSLHIVGDDHGWSIPSSSSFYSTWAAGQTFKAGDTLAFNFVPGNHTVAEVSMSEYDSCTTSSIPLSTDPFGMVITGGTHYYICTTPSHCSAGQKLAITTVDSTTSTLSAYSTTSTPSSSGLKKKKWPLVLLVLLGLLGVL